MTDFSSSSTTLQNDVIDIFPEQHIVTEVVVTGMGLVNTNPDQLAEKLKPATLEYDSSCADYYQTSYLIHLDNMFQLCYTDPRHSIDSRQSSPKIEWKYSEKIVQNVQSFFS